MVEDEILKSETNNSNSQDSFNKDLQKKFEEYKKGEPRIPHRPISSYTSKRNFNQVNKDIDQINQIPNKPQSAQAKSNNNSKNSNPKEHPSKNNTNIANNINENEGNNPDLTAEQILQESRFDTLTYFILCSIIKIPIYQLMDVKFVKSEIISVLLKSKYYSESEISEYIDKSLNDLKLHFENSKVEISLGHYKMSFC